ncbi:S24 family peptidase [Sphingobacterium siyangense]|uniref:S24 family peptidase n=1 Tax=Sphingobacterium siyangense TaxID=459529 RepID=UPI000EF0A173|nr:hypothetical protein [Sphingobacterium sp.]
MTIDITGSIQMSNNQFFDILLPFLEKGKPIKINVVGNSMRPFICNGDQVILANCAVDELKIGRVVLANYRNKFVLHRIISIKGRKICLAGDGNTHQIEIISPSDVKAIAIAASRNSRDLHLNAKINIGLSMLWYYLRPLRKIWRKLKQTTQL